MREICTLCSEAHFGAYDEYRNEYKNYELAPKSNYKNEFRWLIYKEKGFSDDQVSSPAEDLIKKMIEIEENSSPTKLAEFKRQMDVYFQRKHPGPHGRQLLEPEWWKLAKVAVAIYDRHLH